jgi:hypothetical protein
MPSVTARLLLLVGASVSLAASAGCQSTTPIQYRLASVTLAAPPSPGAAADGTTSEVRATFGEWVSARAHGDAATYESLYDTKRFEGIRRTPSGVEKRLTWPEWVSEQRPLLVRGEAPLVTRPVFESWPGTLDAATASVMFDEVARSGDPVQRVLLFGRGADGKLRIVREELAASEGRATGALSNTLARDAKVARAMKN